MADFLVYAFIAVIAITVIALLHRQYYVTQYIYFLRAPLIFSGVTLALPIAAFSFLNTIALNWFDLEPWGFYFVAFLSAMLAWAYMYQFATLWESIPLRNQLPFQKKHHILPRNNNKNVLMFNKLWLWMNEPEGQPPTLKQYLLVPRIFIFALLFSGPILMAAFLQSDFQPFSFLTAFLGMLTAYLLWASFRCEQYLQKNKPEFWLTQWVNWIRCILFHYPRKLYRLIKMKTGVYWSSFFQGIDQSSQQQITFNVYRAYRYIVISAMIYIVVGYWFNPEHDRWLQDTFPPLGYVLLLLTLLSWLLTLLTLLFDKFRIPLILILLLIPLLSPDDHFYDVIPVDNPVVKTNPDNLNVKNHIIVAASGGGISASYWTAVVLEYLHHEVGEAFRIDMISAVSGGSVGSMFYVAAFNDRHKVTTDKLNAVVAAAGKSSLGEVGWGLTYPDFWRNTVNWSSSKDRAWAQEQRWKKELMKLGNHNQKALTMHSLGSDPARTLLALNTTVAETGQRLVFLSRDRYNPGNNGSSCRDTWQNQTRPLYFNRELPGMSIPVQTAARLSATFPYVTPVARMNIDNDNEIPASVKDCTVTKYHLADGGFFDNWGIATSLDYIKSRYLAKSSDQAEKLLLIEIRTNSSADQPKPVIPGLLAPIKTMLNVRTSSQVNRNNDAMEMLQALTSLDEEKRISLTNVVFSLSPPLSISEEETLESPLSWHLSLDEKNAIRNALNSQQNDQSLQQVKAFFLDG